MNEKIYYSAEDIAKMLGVSMGKSYKILREMNKELALEKASLQSQVKFRWSIFVRNGMAEPRR